MSRNEDCFIFSHPVGDLEAFSDAYSIAILEDCEEDFIDMFFYLFTHYDEDDKNLTDISLTVLEYLGLINIETSIPFLKTTF